MRKPKALTGTVYSNISCRPKSNAWSDRMQVIIDEYLLGLHHIAWKKTNVNVN